MNKPFMLPTERLVGMDYLIAKFDKSRSTINRERKNGIFPEPDLPAKVSGSANKWFLSTIDAYYESLKRNVAA